MFSPIQTEREMTVMSMQSPRGDISARAGGINAMPSAFDIKPEA